MHGASVEYSLGGGWFVGVLLVIKEIKQNSILALGAFGVGIILRNQNIH